VKKGKGGSRKGKGKEGEKCSTQRGLIRRGQGTGWSGENAKGTHYTGEQKKGGPEKGEKAKGEEVGSVNNRTGFEGRR